jgi:Uma2 family endonuclease
MSAAQFFQLGERSQPTELIEGVLIVSPSPIPLHQRISGRLERLIQDLMPDGELFHAPIDVYFDDHNTVQPDIVWLADRSRCVAGEERLSGPPDLVVEIFSPSTEVRDRKAKYRLYERYGVREYWMVNPVEQFIEVYVWRDGAFWRQGVYVPGEHFRSAALENDVVVDRVFISSASLE